MNHPPRMLPRIGARRRLRNAQRVALTFDDGPDPNTTPKLLDTLNALDVTATFFVLASSAEREPDLIRDMLRRGHEIGSHGFEHVNHRKVGMRTAFADVSRARRSLEKITGEAPKLFRPAYGAQSIATHIAAAQNAQTVMLWSVDPYDWEPGVTPDTIVDRVVDGAIGGDVVLMHDTARLFSSPREDTPALDAIEPIVTGLRERGFAVGSIGGETNVR